MALPIVIPEICMGVAMLAFFARVGWPTRLPWPLNLSVITIAHISFSFPFAAIVIRAPLVNFNRELEEAGKDLGASEWEIFRNILLPFLRPGIVAGVLLAFTLSLDDFVITFFTAGPETITFPVKVYSMVRFSVTREGNAASTVLILVTGAERDPHQGVLQRLRAAVGELGPRGYVGAGRITAVVPPPGTCSSSTGISLRWSAAPCAIPGACRGGHRLYPRWSRRTGHVYFRPPANANHRPGPTEPS